MVQPPTPTKDIFIGLSNEEWLWLARWCNPFLVTQPGFPLLLLPKNVSLRGTAPPEMSTTIDLPSCQEQRRRAKKCQSEGGGVDKNEGGTPPQKKCQSEGGAGLTFPTVNQERRRGKHNIVRVFFEGDARLFHGEFLKYNCTLPRFCRHYWCNLSVSSECDDQLFSEARSVETQPYANRGRAIEDPRDWVYLRESVRARRHLTFVGNLFW